MSHTHSTRHTNTYVSHDGETALRTRVRVHTQITIDLTTTPPQPTHTWAHTRGGVVSRQSYGGHSERETPGPIPNPEVKPFSADGTATARSWESRTPPDILCSSPASSEAGLLAFPPLTHDVVARHERGRCRRADRPRVPGPRLRGPRLRGPAHAPRRGTSHRHGAVACRCREGAVGGGPRIWRPRKVRVMFYLVAASDKPSRALTLWSSRMSGFSWPRPGAIELHHFEQRQVDSKKCGE